MSLHHRLVLVLLATLAALPHHSSILELNSIYISSREKWWSHSGVLMMWCADSGRGGVPSPIFLLLKSFY